MPALSTSEQLFMGANAADSSHSHSHSHSKQPPIDSATMLLSVLYEALKDFLKDQNQQLAQTRATLEDDYWQSFLRSSWANHWLPEVKYLHQGKWTLEEILVLVLILLLTMSWYTIRNDRKRHDKLQNNATKATSTSSHWLQVSPPLDTMTMDGRSSTTTTTTPKPLLPSMLPTLDVSALSFSAGSSWERRYQTMAMFSCSLAFVLPGTCLCWAAVAHFGVVLPIHVFVRNDYDWLDDYFQNLPWLYEFRTAVVTMLMWGYLLYAFVMDDSPTRGSRKPWVRELFGNWWNHACDFLPVVLVKTADLPATTVITTNLDGNSTTNTTVPSKYVLGYHPHGIIAVGAFCAFATDGARVLDLSKKNTDNDENHGNGNSRNNSIKRSSSRVLMGLPLRPSFLSLLDDDNDDDDDDGNANDNSNGKLPQPTRRGFSSLFPGLDRRIVTLPVNFATPFLREYLLAMGAVTSEKETFRSYLKNDFNNNNDTKDYNRNRNRNRNGDGDDSEDQQQEGKALVVVVGGAAESMLAHEGHIELVLKHRRGFVREAIIANASLVPVLGFGETNLYTLHDDFDGSGDINNDDKINHQTSTSVLDYSATPLWSMVGTFVSVFQKFAKESFGVAVPLFNGRSVFFKSLGVMPRRRPVVVVVGKPIPPPTLEDLGNNHQNSEAGVAAAAAVAFQPKIDRATDQPLNDHGRILIEWHSKYVLALEELYHEYKDAPWNSPGKRRQDSMRIVR